MFLKKKIGDLIRSYKSFDLHFGDAFHSPFHIFLNILILFQRKETISLRFASKRNEWVWLYWNINFCLVNYRHCLKRKKKGTKLLRNIIGGKYITPSHLPFSFYFSPILPSLSSAIRIFKHVLFVLSSRVTYF